MSALKFFRVIDGPINIRLQPDTSAPRAGGQLATGQQVEVQVGSRLENDGFVWWQHALGWSVERSVDGAQLFMAEIIPEAEKPKGNQAVNTNTLPSLTLPTGKEVARPVLFSLAPVRLDQTQWSQYFGNTWFAYNLQFDRNPARQRMYFYAQGLHGGIDYGSNVTGIPIIAGLDGIIDKVERGARSYAPNCVRVTNGEFTIIYGHLGNVPGLKAGDVVQPETRVGEIEGSQLHLHLEVRHKNTWIINPLLFMPPEMTTAFMTKFDKFSKYFYSDATWTRWQTPFDQPILKASAPDKATIIGPRAARG